MSTINGLTSSYLQSVLSTALQNSGLVTTSTAKSQSGTGVTSVTQPTDSQQLSPFAKLLSTLQQLQQTDPTKYKQVTQQIATNLQSAAQTATTDGNTTAASQLNQLANDFTSASKSGELPNIQDLAEATGNHSVGGHHRHHHHGYAQAEPAASDTTTSTGSSASNTASAGTTHIVTGFLGTAQSGGTQSSSLDPMAIILNTLSSAGITTSNG